MTNRRIVLARSPEGRLRAEDFRVEEAPVPAAAAGQLLVRARVLSIDPAQRAYLQGRTYRPKVEPGETMPGYAIAEVIESRADGFAAGDVVLAEMGWQELAAVDGRAAAHQPAVNDLTQLLSVYGTSAPTAHVGLFAVGGLTAGETLVVSAAGGSVGTAVGQIGRIAGATVIGIAGGEDKCRWLVDELGFDDAIDHRGGAMAARLREAAPDGVDVYFDNVGGDVLGAVLPAMKLHGRIVCCGAVADYDGPKPAHGPRGLPGLLITKRVRMEGFLLFDHPEAQARATEDLRAWVADGRFRPLADVMRGLESAPAALVGLLAGENRGKRMVVLD